MRTLFLVALVAGVAVWIGTLQRRLHAARLRGNMYRDVAARLDRQIVEMNAREK
jgi:hypothetical protein